MKPEKPEVIPPPPVRHHRRPSAPQKRGNRWRIQWTDYAGKRRSRTFRTYEEAVRELERVKGMSRFVVDGALPSPPKPLLFKEFAERFYVPNRTMQKRDSKNDLSILRRHLYPAFENFFLAGIDMQAVEFFKGDKLRGGLGPKTLRNILSLLKSMLRYAQDMGFILSVPRIRLPKVEEKDVVYLSTRGDIQALLTAAIEEKDGVMELFATAIYTGMRAGELFGLKWDNVDFDKRLICVARSYNNPSTKSGKVRYVPILDLK